MPHLMQYAGLRFMDFSISASVAFGHRALTYREKRIIPTSNTSAHDSGTIILHTVD